MCEEKHQAVKRQEGALQKLYTTRYSAHQHFKLLLLILIIYSVFNVYFKHQLF